MLHLCHQDPGGGCVIGRSASTGAGGNGTDARSPMKRYPCLGMVSMYLGRSATSQSAWRSLPMAELSPFSKSTTVPSGQSVLCSS